MNRPDEASAQSASQPASAAGASAVASAAQRAAQAHDAAAHELSSSAHYEQLWGPLERAHRERAADLRRRSQTASDGDAAPDSSTPDFVAPDSRAPGSPHAAPLAAPLAARPVQDSLAAAQIAAAQLPSTEAGVSRPPLDLRIGIICDRFLFDTYSGSAQLFPITPENWQDHVGEVDLLLVAATWRGHDGFSWDNTSPEAPARRRLLINTIIPAFRTAGAPPVYYGKEDPPDYRQFLDVARACDHILTTAAEVIEDYRRDCPAALSIEVLPFGVNPLLHSPIGSRSAPAQARELIFFAGSWMGKKYPERARFAEWILDGVLAAGRPLAIVDRWWEEISTQLDSAQPMLSGNQLIPVKYWPYRVPALDHHELMDLQRVVDIAVNLNSVIGSQTMFANRALELQASGTLLLSTYNQGLNSYHPQVRIANSAADVEESLRGLDLEELRRAQGDGVREVFLRHHVTDLLAHVARIARLDAAPQQEMVVAVTETVTAELAQDMAAQDLAARGLGQVELLTWDQLGARAADPLSREIDVLLPLDTRRRYLPHYAADHVAAFRYQSATITTKLSGSAAESDSWAHRHHRGLASLPDPHDMGLDLGLTAWWRPEPAALVSGPVLAASGQDARVYAIDHLGHAPAASVRESGLLPAALPHPGDEIAEAKEQVRRAAEAGNLELSVIVPVYNNGDHLRHKAFASLRRSPHFPRTQVLLVDDGSTDPVTVATVEELARDHPNVFAFRHHTAGSGSASRPRNTGLELAATEFVTYLDPDDEELEAGYHELQRSLAEHPEADFALGTQVTWTDRHMVLPVHDWYSAIERRDGLCWPTRDSLRGIRFRPASIEGLLARTDWLQGLGLTQPEGATGQDTFFFQQLLFHARAYVPVDRPVYVYYGAVDTSIVNVVTPGYFRKYLILEAARSAWLKEEGLLQDYMDTRFEHFFVTWYLWKYSRVPTAQREEAAEVLREIAAFYVGDPGQYPWRTPEALQFFGRRRLPSARKLRPAAGRLKRRARGAATLQLAQLKRTRWGRGAGAVYRRTLKPKSADQVSALREVAAEVERVHRRATEQWGITAAETAYTLAVQRPYSS
ncbi:glycosyltransferase [Nesterenkonia halotolerans]|uniref:Glycosyltransferase involved in cell wall biosynthesis n=1 Tax=Nesterenkonia halotolerans TaxID=225325 RepID=A0ABR9J4G1_9MICC|nr:glycosyltransferase [Nesterenkonia halotolerans]MBE1513883.1 glycosyltransferase involved in cell wall biosynthesis [Nesterenkonia halotolerans]